MNVTRTLTWVSRALFALGLLLFAGLFVYIAAGSSTTGVDANGQKFHSVSAGEMGVLVLVFSSIAWCWLAGAAARTLATAPNWGRALPEIASLVGFGLFFAMPTLLVSGSSAESGATHTFAAAEQVVTQVKDSIAASRAEAFPGPPLPHAGFVEPSAEIFTPEPVEPDRPLPGSQV